MTDKINFWDKRVETMREARSMPRDVYERDVLYTDMRNKAAKKGVRLLWMSRIFLEKRPMCTGFSHDLYQPVTKEIADLIGLEANTNNWTPDGKLQAGADAFLYWAPEEACREQDALMRGSNTNIKSVKEQENELNKFIHQSGAKPIGEAIVSRDAREVREREDEITSPLSGLESLR